MGTWTFRLGAFVLVLTAFGWWASDIATAQRFRTNMPVKVTQQPQWSTKYWQGYGIQPLPAFWFMSPFGWYNVNGNGGVSGGSSNNNNNNGGLLGMQNQGGQQQGMQIQGMQLFGMQGGPGGGQGGGGGNNNTSQQLGGVTGSIQGVGDVRGLAGGGAGFPLPPGFIVGIQGGSNIINNSFGVMGQTGMQGGGMQMGMGGGMMMGMGGGMMGMMGMGGGMMGQMGMGGGMMGQMGMGGGMMMGQMMGGMGGGMMMGQMMGGMGGGMMGGMGGKPMGFAGRYGL